MLTQGDDRAFTLIETMVVLALLTILAGVGYPYMMGFLPKYRVDGAAKELAAKMELYRMKAISGNVRHQITFFDTDQKIVVQTVDPAGAVIATVETITFEDSGDSYPNITLGRNATDAVPDSSNNGTTEFAAFSSGKLEGFTYLPSGIATASGEFFIIPKGDKVAGGPLDRIRAIQVSIGGLVRKFRYISGNASGQRWSQF